MRRNYSKKRVTKKRVAGKRKSSVSVGVKKYVKSQIHKEIENKCQQINGGGAFGNVAGSSTLNMYPMLPYTGYMQISQGLRQNERTGNEIRIRKVMLNYVLKPNAYDAIYNNVLQPVEIDLFLGYVKRTPGELPIAADVTQLFQNGSSTTPPLGTLRDLISVINTDYWHISKRWRHKLGFAEYYGTGTQVASQSFTNNDFKLNVVNKIDITKFCNKTCKFNDATNTNQGKNLFFFYQAVAANGAAFSGYQIPAQMDFWVDFTYEDA